MSYDSNKVHHSRGNVPFSWENKPGERKSIAIKDDHKGEEKAEEEEEENMFGDHIAIKLPPPPYENNNRPKACLHDLNIPLPPCAFAIPPPSRSSSRRGIRKEDDPFLIAYKECTRSSRRKGNLYGSLRKKMSLMSCKSSCSVKDDTIVRNRISYLPLSKSQRDKINNSDV